MGDPTSVSQYREWAKKAVDEVEQRGKKALFVGGTALYLKALVRGLFQGPGADVELRQRLEQVAEEHGDSVLHNRLAALDPATAARLHFHDRRRIVRALEVFELTGTPISILQAEHDQPAPAAVQVFALELPRGILHDRINRRVLGFFDLGLVEEVRGLQRASRPICQVAAEGIGYREVIAMLEGRASLSETIERVQARSRQFAKRQATWFRGLAEVRSVSIAVDEDAEAVACRIAEMIEACSGRCDSPS